MSAPGPARQPHRLGSGGHIDRSRTLSFRFDGCSLTGHPGDTLASALLANGVRLVARSFKYHRPRGIQGEGAEDPSGLVALGRGDRHEPNTRATLTTLTDGLVARSQNRWPSLRWDAAALTAVASAFMPAGFYYKTFITPPQVWPLAGPILRRMAGMGRSPTAPDPDRYEHRTAHCDVLVVGAGPAGLMAAQAAARCGARVILADERAWMGGCLLKEKTRLDGRPGTAWVADALEELASRDDRVTLLPATTVTGQHDHGFWLAADRIYDRPDAPAAGEGPRQRLWHIRATQTVLATGAIERPLVFAGNDRAGVMLAGAARAFVNQYGVTPGRRAVVFTSHDEGYRTVFDLRGAGIEVVAVVDPRPEVRGPLPDRARAVGVRVLDGHVIGDTRGHPTRGLEGVALHRYHDGGMVPVGEWIEADLLAMSGGWSPTLHLHAQTGARPVWDDDLLAFRPDPWRMPPWMAGGCAGTRGLDAVLRQGLEAGRNAVEAAGLRLTGAPPPVPAIDRDEPSEVGEGTPQAPLWAVPKPAMAGGKRFVDIQDDVTAEDIALAHQEGFATVEHLKRYTALGMGTDQGKTSNVNGLALLAEARGEPIPMVGTTTFRVPYTPITMGALAGESVGPRFAPVRRSPMHEAQAEAGAVFQTVGPWLRPRYFPRDGETLAEAVRREVLATRANVGMVDVSFLGKIDIQGPDAAEFLNRVYINGWKSLPVGRVRYGLMLREDGMALDDGTCARLAEDHVAMTTTTANAGRVMAHLEHALQVHWPDLDVRLVSTTDAWAAVAIAGPKSRQLLDLVTDLDVSNEALPFMGLTVGPVCGLPARVFRISFSGELAYEINVPAGYGDALWRRLTQAGAALGLVPYGSEALGVMRIEKGHVAGAELDGRTTPHDLGLGRMVSTKKSFIGKRLLQRPALQDPDRPALVGLVPEDGRTAIPAGSQLIATEHAAEAVPIPMLGHVSSACSGPSVGHPVALGFLKGGLARWEGQTVVAAYPLKGTQVRARVVPPHFHDPDGSRQNA
ncbi:sarcosine oxidase subunit alpha family protein [Roseospira navarrensis]|uniref:Sarcosine oxidase subunit alpha family protein n=1 Tax=Roseospira navarrensis TaxID=140058 RepID=A0A7X1ZC11_9PROT|nr:sarcosine oxidase subunit alpha family protein [Roseospira navarrensis]MQX35773.1 sarcosine oxidase subunit alpha family protein [Roseospira navarrensis]